MTMYLPFFRLAQAPFTIAPDPRYLFMSERHREALAHLLYGVGSGGGIVLLTGEIGAGKTTVCRCFLEQIPADCRVAYIFNPRLTVTELLQTICAEFGIAGSGQADVTATLNHYFNALNDYLLKSHGAGGKNVLIIDEAQNLTAEVLEQLRLLTNLETSQSKLLQIILIGQPELRAMVARPELEQLAQRIIARYHLGSLSRDETALYIAHRLAVAGSAGSMPFSLKTMHLIHRLCDGVPRRINLLCDRALLGAYSAGRHQVGAGVVRRAANEVFGEPEHAVRGARRQWWRGMAAGAAAAASLLAIAAVVPWNGQDAGGPASHAAAWWQALNGQGGRPFASDGSAAASASESVSAAPVAASAASPAKQAAGAAGNASIGAPAVQRTSGSVDVAAVTSPAAAVPSDKHLAVTSADSASAVTPHSAVVSSSVAQFEQALPLTDPGWLSHRPVLSATQLLPVLATYWGATLAAGDPCTAAQLSGLRCYVGRGGLAELRQLNRPAVLSLRDGSRQIRPVLLLALNPQRALLHLDGKPYSIGLPALQKMFTGEFATFWRALPTWRDYLRTGDRGVDVDWLATQLARARGENAAPAGQAFEDGLIQRLREFQQARGLLADGVAGPRTFMALNQVAGIIEPQLRNAAAAVTEK